MFSWLREDRVKRSTSSSVNERLRREAEERVAEYAVRPSGEVQSRIEELEQEWDMERLLETNASVLALSGAVLGYFVDRRWLFLPMVVTGFLLQHAVQGWCPPVPAFRRLGVRTRQEIDQEITALKALRGDFRDASAANDPAERARWVHSAAGIAQR